MRHIDVLQRVSSKAPETRKSAYLQMIAPCSVAGLFCILGSYTRRPEENSVVRMGLRLMFALLMQRYVGHYLSKLYRPPHLCPSSQSECWGCASWVLSPNRSIRSKKPHCVLVDTERQVQTSDEKTLKLHGASGAGHQRSVQGSTQRPTLLHCPPDLG